ncbi:hypothetical protein DPEC_G00215860 [Dallia pectoralis]|uniref:Uncharacterized protein n=1 Tax=Dallia pectoralis TaxID=75939 RepID=A0ACC2G2I7_DALPE|nr:hypothetical protein DPEC_G00215860 [Dallia pectoralis]
MAASSKSGYEGKIAGLYDLDRTLGKGHFAVVKLARHVFTGQLVAVKVIDKTKLDAMATGHLLQEVRCMKLVQHPNVVRLYEVIDTATALYLILELGDGGDMYDYILRHEGGVAEDTAKVHFAQIVQAISYCHRLHVVHRDLKPENVVFFRQQGTVKLTDFGFSNLFKPGTMLMTSCGSLAYSAPEILLGEEYDAPAVDIWSLGVILYMLVCGQPPFQETNDSETLTMIMDCRYTVPAHVSGDCKDLISRMLQREPSGRASLNEIKDHPWLIGVDASPAGHTAAPFTSHRSLSPEEHEVILQNMASGNIAGRDAIQEALEADRYNHMTATYYLLGERMLRDKQEQPGERPKVDSAWAEPPQLHRPVSDPLDLERMGLHGLLAGCPRRGVSESGDFLANRPLQLQPQPRRRESPFPEYSAGPSLGLSLRPPPPDEPLLVKSLGALQLICEEEEDEEEEEEEEGKTQMELPNIKTLPHIGVPVSTTGSADQSSRPLSSPEVLQSPVRVGPCPGEKTEREEGDRPPQDAVPRHRGVQEQSQEAREGKPSGPSADPLRPGVPTTALENLFQSTAQSPLTPETPPPRLGPVQCCLGRRETRNLDEVEVGGNALLENNNNTAVSKAILPVSAVGSAPHTVPRNHCVDLGPDGVEMSRKLGGARGEPGGAELQIDRSTSAPTGQPAPREAGSDPAVRLDPGKAKNVNLRDRLLQFPLCEKALSFNIQPTSKEKILPFAQYNCCHVL